MAHLIINVLGALQFFIDDVPVQSFESDKVRALLAYLAVEADQPHPREALIGLLWPDFTEETARHNLSQALFNLRLALGDHSAKPPYLIISRDSIQFNAESDYSLDFDTFDHYFSMWQEKHDHEITSFSTLISQLEEMVRLYRGEFLQHFYIGDSAEFENWIVVQRESLRQHMMDALTYLSSEYERHGDLQAAHRYASRQLELDPWREEAHYQIMRVLALDGKRSAALAQYENCKRVLAEEVGAEPSAKTRDLYEQIRSDKLRPKEAMVSDVPSASIHNLPVLLTPFLGREPELADLAELIADPTCRCITLVGPGGIGKTRLALQAADQHSYSFADGAAFVPLASVGSIDTVISAIANAIHFAFYGPSDPRAQLLNYLRDKQMLLIVDNVEHLLEEAPQPETVVDLLVEILHGAAHVKLLITSREALNLQGERTFEVQGLAFPDREEVDGIDEFSAVALFIQRARQVRPGFVLNVEDKTGIVRLCRLVEGLPLAIELAATWMRILSPGEIATEIERGLDFLNAQTRDLPERHRSMRAVFDHSWQRLPADEQQILGSLSVFRGGFQRQAAEQVAGASLPILSSLVIRSLLRRTGVGRYDLHELIRQYAASKLGEDPEKMRSAQERHSLYYLGLLEEQGVRLQTHQQKNAVTELTGDMDNIRAAWDWSIANHEFLHLYQESARLMHLFEVRNWFKEGEITFRKTANSLRATGQESELDAVHQVALHAMLAHWGFFRFRVGKGEEAYNILSSSAAFLRTSTGHFATIYSHLYLGIDCWILGKFSEAKESLQTSRMLARKFGEHWHEALDSEFLGRVAIEQGEYTQARQYLSDALVLLRQLGDPSMTAHTLSYLGRAMQLLGEYREAEQLLRESLDLSRENGYRFATGLALDGLGRLAYAEGRFEEAQPFFSEGARLFQEMGDTHRLSRTLNHQGLNSLALNQALQARNHFSSALRLAYEGGFTPSTLNALTGLATLDVHQRTSQGLLELILYILQNPASTQETKYMALPLQVELESKLPQEVIEAAHQQAGLKRLDDFVRPMVTSFQAS